MVSRVADNLTSLKNDHWYNAVQLPKFASRASILSLVSPSTCIIQS